MASFAASLISGSTVGLVKSCSASTITITDYSNYSGNSDPAHAAANFSLYRKVFLSLANGYGFILSSLGDGDQLISAASSGSNSFTYTIAGGDGVYVATLLTIPTWSNNASPAATYITGDLVYVASTGLIYQSQANANLQHNPVGDSGTWWLPISEADALLVPKYANTQKVIIDCALSNCIDTTVTRAACSVSGCDGVAEYDQCDNEYLLNSLELKAIQLAITTLSTTPSEFNKVQCLFDRASALCCSTC